MKSLLPNDFDQLLSQAVKQFWMNRLDVGRSGQEGNRAAVIAGKNMDGFLKIIEELIKRVGMDESASILRGKKRLTIPGYFRPTKMWDAMVIYKGYLLAAFEFKSHVGSFGNNFNNRAEESVGSAFDFWTANRENAYAITNNVDQSKLLLKDYFKSPFLAYLALVESCKASSIPVRVDEQHFNVFPEFKNTSYLDRYKLLCQKLENEKLYSSTALVFSDRESGLQNGEFSSPQTLHPKHLFRSFANHLSIAVDILG